MPGRNAARGEKRGSTSSTHNLSARGMWPKRTAIALFAMGFVGCDRSPVTVPATNPTAEKSSIPSPANKRMHFEHQEFVLDLDSSWARVAGNDPEQFQF